MSEIQISNGCFNEENIKSLVNIPKNEERICFALYSPITNKAALFHCKDEDSIRAAMDIYQDLTLNKYIVVTIQVPIEEINSIVCMAKKLSPEIVLDFFF